MVQVLVSIVALFFSLVLLVAGNAMLNTVVALRLEIEGFTTGVAGLILALYSVGFVAGSLLAIRVVRRVGYIRAFTAFASLAGAAALVHPLYIDGICWAFLRLILGFCFAGLMLVVESWLNARATNETRGQLLATYMVLFYLASAGGQFLMALGDPAAQELFMLAVILICLASIPVSLTRSPTPEPDLTEPLSVFELWRVAELGVSGAFLSGVAMSAFATLGPIYAFQKGLPVEQVAAFMGLAILGAMFMQWPVGYLSDFVNRRIILVVIGGLTALASLVVVWAGQLGPLGMYLSVAVFYGFAASLYPVALALTHDALQNQRLLAASSTFLLTFGIGTILGPTLGGLAVSYLGPDGLFYFVALMLSSLLVLSIHSFATEELPAVEDQSHCIGVSPISSPVIIALDPRNEEFEEVVVEPEEPVASDPEEPAATESETP